MKSLTRDTRAGVIVLGLACAFGASAKAYAGGLTIDAIFATDPTKPTYVNPTEQSAIIEALSFYSQTFSNPITVDISFQNDSTTALGASATQVGLYTYASYAYDLSVTASHDATDTTALAHIPVPGSPAAPVNNPVTNSPYINLTAADVAAVGGSVSPVSNAGTISINMAETDVAGCTGSDCFSLAAVVQHETDEVLGLGSNAGPNGLTYNLTGGGTYVSHDPDPEDLFRYNSSGGRSYYDNGGNANTGNSYFSLDGTTDLAQFNNAVGNPQGDFGDWQSNPLPAGVCPKVQDAFGTPLTGSVPSGCTFPPLLTINSPEVVALDAIGYNLQPTPETATGWLLGAGMLAMLGMTWREKRRSLGGKI